MHGGHGGGGMGHPGGGMGHPGGGIGHPGGRGGGGWNGGGVLHPRPLGPGGLPPHPRPLGPGGLPPHNWPVPHGHGYAPYWRDHIGYGNWGYGGWGYGGPYYNGISLPVNATQACTTNLLGQAVVCPPGYICSPNGETVINSQGVPSPACVALPL